MNKHIDNVKDIINMIIGDVNKLKITPAQKKELQRKLETLFLLVYSQNTKDEKEK